MAAVEEAAVAPSLSSQIPPVSLKNTARKSTSKPPNIWPGSSGATKLNMNGVVESGPSISNGDSATKRQGEPHAVANPAKVARLQIEEMERDQEEMTRKVTRHETGSSHESNGSGDNGPANGELEIVDESSHSSNPVNSSAEDTDGNTSDKVKQNSETELKSAGKSALAITANMKDSFKGILNVAMAKLGSQSGPCSGQSSGRSSRCSTPDTKVSTSQQSLQNSDSMGNIDKGNLFEKLSNIAGDSSLVCESVDDTTSASEKALLVESEDDGGINLLSDDDEAELTEKKDTVVVLDPSLEDKLLQPDDAEDPDDAGDVDESVLDDPTDVRSSEDVSGKDCDKETPDKETSLGDECSPTNVNGPQCTEENGEEESEMESEVFSEEIEKNKKSPADSKTPPMSGNDEELATGVENTDNDVKPSSDPEVDKDSGADPQSSNDALMKEGEDQVDHEESEVAPKDSQTKDGGDGDVKQVEMEDAAAEEEAEEEDDDEEDEEKRPVTPEDNASHTSGSKSEMSESGAKKRRPTSPLSTDSTSGLKKSRLDQVIGRLGSAIGIKPHEVEEEDVDEEEEEDKESDLSEAAAAKTSVPASPLDGKEDTVMETKVEPKSEVQTETQKDVKPEDVEKKADVKKLKKPDSSGVVTVTAEELNELLVRRMTAFLETSRGSVITTLQRRITELQSSVELWRSHAKQLAMQVTELSSKQLGRRRSSGRNVMKRNMAIQVDEKTQKQVALLQNSSAGKVTIRTPPRVTPPKSSPVSVASGTQPTPIAPATLRSPNASLVKTATVRDLLDKQRSDGGIITTTTTTKSGAKSQTVSIPPGSRIMVSGAQILPRGTIVNTVRQSGGVSSTVVGRPQPVTVVKGVIDLTDDVEDARNKEGGKTIIRTLQQGSTAQLVHPQIALRHGTPITQGGTTLRPGTVLVQQTPNSAPVLVQPSIRAPQGTTFLYTSTRPGTVMVPATPGSSLVRPAIMTTSTTTSSAPPTLRPAGQIYTVQRPSGAITNTTTTVINRPPPPLKSAPQQTNQPKPMKMLPANRGAKHPAPLPPMPPNQLVGVSNAKLPPPKPGLKISRVQQGIVLSWNMNVNDSIAEISNYQLFAYQETSAPPSTNLWKKVGDVKALPLPMACTLTQFQEGNKYHFSVRALDIHGRVGPLSEPSSIALTAINVS